MKVLFSIILNGIAFMIISILLSLELSCKCGYFSLFAFKTYIFSGVIFGVLNYFLGLSLKFANITIFTLLFLFVSTIFNAILLGFLTYFLNDILQISGIGYTIGGRQKFIICIAIFTFLNMFYSILIFKKK